MTLQIDRLTLRVPGMPDADGRALGRLVAERLAAEAPRLTPRRMTALAVGVRARPGEGPESLAGRIVSEVLRTLGASI